nr:VOC family protein [Propionicimonas sp.]
MALLNPYLSFTGNARDALEFYRSVFGGELTISTYGEFQMAEAGSADADRVMHGQLTTSPGFTLMASDIPPGTPLNQGSSITISLSGSEGDGLRGYWDSLADGGNVSMPLEKAPWGDYFGQLTDRFGTDWMVNIAGSGDAG